MEKKIIKILSKVKHPEINSNLVELGMVGSIKENKEGLLVEIKVPFLEIPIKAQLAEIVKNALSKQDKTKVIFSVMSSKERAKFMKLAQENWAL